MKKYKKIILMSVGTLAILILVLYIKLNEIGVHPLVSVILREEGITSINIKKLCEYDDYKLDTGKICVNDDEIQQYVSNQLESFSEIIPITDRKVVEMNDVVYVSYTVECDGHIVKQVEHDSLIVGLGKYDRQFEATLVGRSVCQPFSVLLNTSTEGEEIYVYNIFIESINYFKTYELTDEFVTEHFDMSTVAEYYEYCKEKIEADKKYDMELEAQKKLFMSLVDNSEIILDTNEVSIYSKRIVEQYMQLANVYDLELNEYVEQILNQDIDAFYQECYELGEYQIKYDILIGAIFYDLGYSVSDEEYRSVCEEKDYDYNEARKDEYTDALISFEVMEQKVLEYFYNKSDESE